MLLVFVMAPVLMASVYLSYRDVFSPPPPPPPPGGEPDSSLRSNITECVADPFAGSHAPRAQIGALPWGGPAARPPDA
jgi:hypothetical protein